MHKFTASTHTTFTETFQRGPRGPHPGTVKRGRTQRFHTTFFSLGVFTFACVSRLCHARHPSQLRGMTEAIAALMIQQRMREYLRRGRHQNLRSGRELFKQSRFAQAAESFRAELHRASVDEHCRLHCNLALCHLKLSEPEMAIKEADMSLKCNAQYQKARYHRGCAYQQLRLSNKALADFKAVSGVEAATRLRDLRRLMQRVDPYLTALTSVSMQETTMSPQMLLGCIRESRDDPRRVQPYDDDSTSSTDSSFADLTLNS
eukprot:6061400-Prymnesium_polylepis.1